MKLIIICILVLLIFGCYEKVSYEYIGQIKTIIDIKPGGFADNYNYVTAILTNGNKLYFRTFSMTIGEGCRIYKIKSGGSDSMIGEYKILDGVIE